MFTFPSIEESFIHINLASLFFSPWLFSSLFLLVVNAKDLSPRSTDSPYVDSMQVLSP